MKRRTLRILIYLVPIVSIIGLIAIAWYQRERQVSFLSDAATIREPLDAVNPRDVLWSPAVKLPGLLNTQGNEFEPAVSPDGFTLYFVRGRMAHNADLFFSTKTPTGWTEPQPLLTLNTVADELGPEPSADGKSLYFYSDRVGGLGGYDLWVALRDEDGNWSDAVNLGPEVNSRDHDYGPCVSPDGQSLYFASDRPALMEGTAIEGVQVQGRDYDLYVATMGESGLGEVVPVDELNSPSNEGAPSFSESGDFLYFASDRRGGSGGFDLYRSRVVHGQIRTPRNLGDSINTMANEIDPAMTLGGFGIHFSSDRVETEGVASNGLYDLYYAQSREVFIETETHRATIDWAALIALLLPYLIWLLLMLSTMGVLAAVIRRLEYNRMGLLTRCLMGSLIAHLVLLALLTLWGVSTSLSEAISPGSSTRVVLTSPSVGRGIAEQIRGEMTDVEIDAEMEEARQQQFEAEVQPPSFEDAEMELEQTTLESFDLLETQVAMNEAQAQSLDTPDVELLEPAEAQEIEHTTPAEARREQASEAIARVPDTAVSNPTATRALDEATPQPAQTYDTHVAMNVERAEMPNDSNERLAERSGANEARAESSSTLMEVQPTEVSASEARDVPLPFVPVSKNKRTSEAQTNTALKPGEPGELDRQTQAARVEVAQASQSEVELQTPRATQQLAMQSMANPTEAKASTNANEMTPLTSSDVAPQTQASEVALQDMPSQEASKASEAQTRIQVAIAQAGRTDASEAFESAGAPAQAIEVNPEASRLVASERLSNAMSMNEASNEASPLPAMHAKVAESSEASSDLALSTPRLDTQARQQSNEARQATTTQPLPSIRTASVNMPSDLQSTHANEVAVNTQSNPVAMESTTLSHVEIHESSTTSPSELSSSYENAVVMNEPQTVQVDLPSDAGDQGGQSSREANMPPATSLANMTGTSSDSRQTTSTEVQAATSDSQVALNPTQGTLKLDSNSMAGVESRESSTTSEMTLTNPSRQVEPGQQVAMNLELPDEQASGEVRPTSGVEHALMPLVATSRSNRVEHATSSLSETSPASTQVVMSPTRAAPSSESSTLASRTTRDASWQSTQVPALQNSAALPTPSSTTFALDLPMEQESPTQHNAAPSHQQSDRLSKSTIAKYSPSASQSSDPAMTSVVMNPSSQPRESFAHRLFEDALASDNGDTPSLNPPLASQDFAQGLVIPPLAAVSLPGMEQGSQAEQQETRTRQAKRSSQSKQRNRFKQEYLDAPATGTSRRSLTSLPPAIMPASVDVNRQFASRGRVDDSMRLPNDFHLPQPDLDLAKTPEALGMDLNLSLPLEQLVTLDPYKQRADEFRETMVEVMGGSEETEHAVTMGLDWLARHQSRNGSWDGDSFDNQCGECDGRAKVQVDIGLTGLSLLCFLAADHTHLKDGPYRETVERGLRWLRRQQHRTGSIMTNESLYSHGIATIALAEAYGMTGDPELAQPVQRAIDFTFAARNKGVGGWRYGPGQVGDTSVLGWQMMSFKSADRAGLDVPREAFLVGQRWLDLVSQSSPPGQYRYQPDGEVTPAMTAEGLFVRQLLGTKPDDEQTKASVKYILDRLPDWEEECNVYYWYYATLAMFQHQGEAWETWNTRVKDELLAHQHTSGRQAGSWDPDGRWASIGGRVYQTAISTLILEVYYRYLPTFVGDTSAPARSAITGRVTDATTGVALPGAMIRLDLDGGRSVTARADSIGQYTLLVPDVPEHIAVSASHEGYTPESISVAADEVKQESIVRDFKLTPIRGDVIALELDPEVHHLGNNEFTGRINSQFQKESEGLIYQRSFAIEETQLSGENEFAQVELLVRGVQTDNPIFINGHELDSHLNRCPRDGSFGEFKARFPLRWLQRGENLIEIRSVQGSFDHDDFEFVNVQIVLNPEEDDDWDWDD